LVKPTQNIWQSIKTSLVPPGLSPSVKAILILFYLSVGTVGLDLSKDMAKGEFEYFEGVLTESNTIDSFAYLDYLISDPPLIGVVLQVQFIPTTSDVVQLYRSRAPPASPFI
jgi:hypothetical protein